jgi:hypothetical protein
MTVQTCSVCGREIGVAYGGWGMWAHAKAHIREFERKFGFDPGEYGPVRDALSEDTVTNVVAIGPQLTLACFAGGAST